MKITVKVKLELEGEASEFEGLTGLVDSTESEEQPSATTLDDFQQFVEQVKDGLEDTNSAHQAVSESFGSFIDSLAAAHRLGAECRQGIAAMANCKPPAPCTDNVEAEKESSAQPDEGENRRGEVGPAESKPEPMVAPTELDDNSLDPIILICLSLGALTDAIEKVEPLELRNELFKKAGTLAGRALAVLV
ncbi:MAG: hypothetical protein LBL84_03630 [Candidatus Nomurabacteria bacterium]|jgi:hypothetical protein|nr:hypothetical protein [Candidatus Nomurabacteria bacterium]